MASNTTATSSGRKYLCSAPRPDTWDEYLPSILKHLGKNDEERKDALSETLEKARATNPFVKKIGPGRKTNAEHAIHFYEYLLEYLKEGKAKGSDDQPTSEEEDEDEDEDEVERSGEAETQGEHSSMNTEEFNSQHNDVCDVCEEAGELLMCSTCNLVFHVKCVRPILDTVPNDKNWRCSYCILQTEPKNSKPRKQAAAAVRLMARLRNQNRRRKRDKQAGSADDSSESVDAEDTDQNESSQEDEPKPDSEKLNSGKSNEHPDADAVGAKQEKKELSDVEKDPSGVSTVNEKSTPATEGNNKEHLKSSSGENKRLNSDSDSPDANIRSKRNRKQPTLYDPQVGPARQWQSDELIEWKLGNIEKNEESNQGDQNDENEDSSSGGDENPISLKIAERTKGGEVWCGFCGDDPSVVVCFFCACRVCFGKHHQSKLLLCDQCDDEYHTFCLKPPLKTVPKSKKWFCPSCKASEEKRLARTSTRISTRAAVTSAPSPRRSSARKSISTLKASESKPDSPSTPRPRLSNASTESRKRGRPKSSPESSLTSPPRKRGRPPKSASKGKTDLPRTGDGKSDYSETLSTRSSVTGQLGDDAAGSIPWVPSIIAGRTTPTEGETPSLVSRSGRHVKRNSLLGAIGEGDQHLRTTKPGDSLRQESSVQTSTKPKPDAVPTKLAPSQQLVGSNHNTQNRPEHLSSTSKETNTDGAKPTVAKEANPGAETLKVQDQIDQSGEGGLKTAPKDEQVSAEASGQPSDPEIRPVGVSTGPEVATMTSQHDHSSKQPRRKPGARECMQISRRFGVDVVPEKYMEILLDYCNRGKVEHLIRMRERLDDHSRFLEQQLAGLEALVKEKGESDITVPTKLSEEEEAKLPKHRKTTPQNTDSPIETPSMDQSSHAVE